MEQSELYGIAESAWVKLETGDTFTVPNTEVWIDIPGFEGVYQVSSYGRVMRIGKTGTKKSRRGDTLLKIAMPTNSKHPYVQLIKDGRIARRARVCALVAELFLGCPVGEVRFRHRDGDVYNNRADNITWKSKAETAKLDSKRRRNSLIDRRAILFLASEGISHALLARAYGLTDGAITHLIERHENKVKYGKAMPNKMDDDERKNS